MPLTLISAPTEIPVTLAEAKLHLRIEDSATEEDALITRAIKAATAACENMIRRAIMTQTWEISLDEFPSGPIRLARPPVQAITSISYYREGDGQLVLLDGADYYLDTATLPGWACCDPEKDWPLDVYERAGAVMVRFTAGYADAASVPEPIKEWIFCAIEDLYRNRGVMIDSRDKPNDFINGLLDGYTVAQL